MSSLFAVSPGRLLPLIALILIAGWLVAVLLRQLAQRFGAAVVRPGVTLWRAGWERPRTVLRRHAPRFTAWVERRFDPGPAMG